MKRLHDHGPVLLGRRNLLCGAAAVLAVGALEACGRKEAGAEGTHAASAPRQGGELVVAFDGAAIPSFVLDPQNSLFAPHNRVMQ